MNKVTVKIPGMNDFGTQEAYKVLRTNLQFCGPDIRVIAVTSCLENEGKSTVSLHLARSMAEMGKRVLVIDADMRKSVMQSRNTDARQSQGLSESLTGQARLADCICETQYPTMHLLLSGQYPPNPVELLEGKYFSTLLTQTRKVFDYIIVDTPPLGQVIDAAVIAPKCDGIILVLGSDRVRYRDVMGVKEQLEKGGSRILGLVRNNVRSKNRRYYNKYYYGGEKSPSRFRWRK